MATLVSQENNKIINTKIKETEKEWRTSLHLSRQDERKHREAEKFSGPSVGRTQHTDNGLGVFQSRWGEHQLTVLEIPSKNICYKNIVAGHRVYTYDPSADKAGGTGVQGQLQLHSKPKTNLGYRRPCLK